MAGDGEKVQLYVYDLRCEQQESHGLRMCTGTSRAVRVSIEQHRWSLTTHLYILQQRSGCAAVPNVAGKTGAAPLLLCNGKVIIHAVLLEGILQAP